MGKQVENPSTVQLPFHELILIHLRPTSAFRSRRISAVCMAGHFCFSTPAYLGQFTIGIWRWSPFESAERRGSSDPSHHGLVQPTKPSPPHSPAASAAASASLCAASACRIGILTSVCGKLAASSSPSASLALGILATQRQHHQSPPQTPPPQHTRSHPNRPQNMTPIPQHLRHGLRPGTQRRQLGLQLLHLLRQARAEVAELFEVFEFGFFFGDAGLEEGGLGVCVAGIACIAGARVRREAGGGAEVGGDACCAGGVGHCCGFS